MHLVLYAAVILSGFVFGSNAAQADCPVTSNICTLDPSYSTDPSGQSFSEPRCQGSNDPVTAAERFFIISAINSAKGQLKKDLCELTRILIIRGSSQQSWGLWADPVNHSSDGIANNTYVGIHVDDMNRTFSDKQDANNTALFGSRIGNHSETNTSAVPELHGLLYVLAHEMGHIKWHSGGSVNRPCQNQISGNPWSDLGTTPRWTTFGGPHFGTRDTTQIPWPQGVSGPDDVNKIYKDTFATALASTNTEEDFVDTYSLRAVFNACKSNQCKFQYQFGSHTVDLTTGDPAQLEKSVSNLPVPTARSV
jgi:hypothetical protein